MTAALAEIRIETPALPATNKLVEQAKSCKIANTDDLEFAVGDLQAIKAQSASLEKKRKELTGPLDQAKKALMDFFRPATEALEEAERIYKAEITRYQTEQERIAAEARRVAEEAARKERERLAAEARQREEDARKAAEQGDTAKAEQMRAEAQQIEIEAAVTPASVVVQMPAKVAGIAMREVWSAEVDDPIALIKAVAEGRAPANLVIPDTKALNALAKALKSEMKVPGVRAVKTASVAAGRAV